MIHLPDPRAEVSPVAGRTPFHWRATVLIASLQWRRLWRRRLPWAGTAVVAVVATLGVVACWWSRGSAVGGFGQTALATTLQSGFFSLLAYLVPLALCANPIGEELQTGTLAYLNARPVPAWSLVIGKIAVGAAASATCLAAGVLLLTVSTLAALPNATLVMGIAMRSVLALTLLAFCYAAMAAMWSAWAPSAARLLWVGHLVVADFLVARLPGGARFLSPNFLAQQIADLGRLSSRFADISAVGATTASLLIVGIGVLFALFAWLGVASRDYRFAGD